MHIVPTNEDPDKILFSFFEDHGDYNQIGQESANRFDFDAAMVANDIRDDQDYIKRFIVILFSKDPKKTCFAPIQFTHPEKLKKTISKSRTKCLAQSKSQELGTTLWQLDEMTEPVELDVSYSLFVNAFIVEGKHLVIFCNQYMLTCALDNIHALTVNRLEMIKNHDPDQAQEEDPITEENEEPKTEEEKETAT